eukprot:evm.model.scf_1101.2 EVM.evm.TU.scf_1101.2   scf_1101:7642-9041(+)
MDLATHSLGMHRSPLAESACAGHHGFAPLKQLHLDWQLETILDGLEPLAKRPKTHLEEAYTRRYAVNVNGLMCHDQYFYIHPNGICITGITKVHPLVKEILAMISRADQHIQDESRPHTPDGGASVQNQGFPLGKQSIVPVCQPGTAAGVDADNTEGPLAPEQGKNSASKRVCMASESDGQYHSHVVGCPTDGDSKISRRPEQVQHCEDLGTQGEHNTAKEVRDKLEPSINFNVGKSNRLDVKSNGKRWRDGQRGKGRRDIILQPDSVICKVNCGDNTFVVRACTRGKLLQVNQRLTLEPRLIAERCQAEGYIALLHLRQGDSDHLESTMMAPEDYAKLRGLHIEELGLGSGM